jgi:hypothetical protein
MSTAILTFVFSIGFAVFFSWTTYNGRRAQREEDQWPPLD